MSIEHNFPADAKPHGFDHLGTPAVPHSIAVICALMLVIGGGLDVYGWYAHVPIFKSVLPGLATMKVNTGIGFILCGLSILSLHSSYNAIRIFRRVTSMLVVLLALSQLLEYAFAANFGIDEFFLPDPTTLPRDLAGRMSVMTAVCFMMYGVALCTESWAPHRYVAASETLALSGLIIAFLAVVGYTYSTGALYEIFIYSSIAIHTSVGFLITGVAILSLHARRGIFSTILASGSTGKIARRLFPTIFVVPLILGWLITHGQHSKLYGSDFGIALYTISNIIIFTLVVFWCVYFLQNAEVIQAIIQKKLKLATLRKDDAYKVMDLQKQRYQNLFGSIDQGLCVIEMQYDDEGRPKDYLFIEVNPAFERHTGIKDAAGKTIREIVPDIEEHWLETYGEVAKTGVPQRFVQVAASLGGRSFDAHAFRLSAEDGNKVAILFTDITDRLRNEDNLIKERNAAEAANIAKTEFLANMSHEIRTPMNAIVGLSNILGMSLPLSEKQKEYIKTLQQSSDSLLDLINDLLDISKIEAKSVDLELIAFDVHALLDDTINMMSMRAREKGLEFTAAAECGMHGVLVGDANRIKQIVLNLCSNAIKFTEAGSVRLEVACTPNDKPNFVNLVISVVDTGIGIDVEVQRNIFQKFVQADSSINRKYGGTGLGLAITKMLAEVMDGSIEMKSNAGQGSTFKVTLPLETGVLAMPNPKADAPALTKSSDPSLRILLVEDYPPNILVAGAYLESFGYDYDTVDNGVDAVQMAEDNDYFAILMDVQMPGMNGFDATMKIRMQEKISGKDRIPIIGMTAHALTGDRDMCLAADMDDYLSKPYNPDELQGKLAEYAARKKVAA